VAKSGRLTKILWHDGLGMSLYANRLGCRRFLAVVVDGVVTITPTSLAACWSASTGGCRKHTTERRPLADCCD
jgi:transposase